jgi:hypothetical protein
MVECNLLIYPLNRINVSAGGGKPFELAYVMKRIPKGWIFRQYPKPFEAIIEGPNYDGGCCYFWSFLISSLAVVIIIVYTAGPFCLCVCTGI